MPPSRAGRAALWARRDDGRDDASPLARPSSCASLHPCCSPLPRRTTWARRHRPRRRCSAAGLGAAGAFPFTIQWTRRSPSVACGPQCRPFDPPAVRCPASVRACGRYVA
eukprot:4364987-Prymnesium_polylepis.1